MAKKTAAKKKSTTEPEFNHAKHVFNTLLQLGKEQRNAGLTTPLNLTYSKGSQTFTVEFK